MKQLLAIFLLVALFSSCTQVQEKQAIPNENGSFSSVALKMNVTPERLDVIDTRAVDESAISDVNLYLFGDFNYHFFENSSNIMLEVVPGEYTLYAVANIGESFGENLTEEELNKLSISNAISGDKIVMTTKLNVSVPSNMAEYTLPELTLFRCVAKVTYNISVHDDVKSKIKLHSVVMHNEATQYSLFDINGEPSADSSHYLDGDVIDVEGTTQYSNTIYMAENMQGVVSSITNQRDKTAENAPQNATALKVYAKGTDKVLEYTVYLGENNTSDFNIRRNAQYTMNIVIMGENEIDGRMTAYDGLYYGTANCIINTGTSVTFDVTPYRTSKEQKYRYTGIKAGSEYNATKVGVYWQDQKGLIKSYSLSNNKVTVTTSGAEGNALVVIYNSSNEVAWSYHIWCTDQPELCEYAENSYGNSYIAMDRNLGATSADVGDVSSYGLLYQWGRKDPFIGASEVNSTISADLYTYEGALIDFSDYCVPRPSGSTISTGIKNPMTLYYGEINWYDGGDTYEGNDPYLWGDVYWGYDPVKSVYDPSPEGYKVSPIDFLLIIKKDGSISSSNSSYNNCYTYWSFSNGWRLYYDGAGVDASKVTYYPACGYRYTGNEGYGNLNGVGTTASYWTSRKHDVNYSCHARLNSSTLYINTTSNYSSTAMSVRSFKE